MSQNNGRLPSSYTDLYLTLGKVNAVDQRFGIIRIEFFDPKI